MKIIELELILTHSRRKNSPSQVELFSVFYFKNASFLLEKDGNSKVENSSCG